MSIHRADHEAYSLFLASGALDRLSVRGLSKSFGGLKAVQDVSFEVSKGEVNESQSVSER